MNDRYKITILIILFFTFITSINAQQVSQEEARTVAYHFLNSKNINIQNFRQEKLSANDGPFYLFNFNQGFILLSNQKGAYPVIAWSGENNFPPDAIPLTVKFWLKNYEYQLNQGYTSTASRSIINKRTWKQYLANQFKNPTPGESVQPLLHSYWNQGCFFNSALPLDSTLGQCNHPYTGCVPTALAQVMQYYNFPKHGNDSLEINSPYGPLFANFATTYFSWLEMENQVYDENPAVAELLYQCVVAVKSQFFPQGTGAYDQDAMLALTSYFGYDHNIQFLMRDVYPYDWLQLMRDELNEDRPVLYGGVDETTLAGHTFVCDGFQDSTFFHINWGWGGQYNGYYYLDSLIAGGQNYNFLQDAIVGIRPDIDPNGELYPPTNLSAQIEANKVSLTWDAPQANSFLELLGYNIYRDDSLLNNSIVSNLYFDELVPSAGTHHYAVQSVFIGNGQGPSTFAEIQVSSIQTSSQKPFHLLLQKNKSQLYLFTDHMIQIEHMLLFNSAGALLFKSAGKQKVQQSIKWQVPVLPAGMYVVQIQTDDSIFVDKVLAH